MTDGNRAERTKSDGTRAEGNEADDQLAEFKDANCAAKVQKKEADATIAGDFKNDDRKARKWRCHCRFSSYIRRKKKMEKPKVEWNERTCEIYCSKSM
jgi:hypothetical protein